MKNILLTGLPRSGTTLTVSLLNRGRNVVALHEPIKFSEYKVFGDCAVSELNRYFSETREKILVDGFVGTKVVAGGGSNPFGSVRDTSGKRVSLSRHEMLEVTKKLTSEFTLIIKHPMLITALLPVLKESFPVYATIRNPLANILSWNSVSAPVSIGRVPAAEARDLELKQRLDSESNCINRQLLISDWMFRRYKDELPSRSVIRYEDIVSSDGGSLSVIDGAEIIGGFGLQSKNVNKLYSRDLVAELMEKLTQYPGAWSEFYSNDDVVDLGSELLNRLE